MVDKYLNNNERVICKTKRLVQVDDDENFLAYLTNQRLILLKRSGLIFKKDRVIDILLKHINGVNMEDEGIIFKKKYLIIRGPNRDIKLYGKQTDLQDIHTNLNEQLLE